MAQPARHAYHAWPLSGMEKKWGVNLSEEKTTPSDHHQRKSVSKCAGGVIGSEADPSACMEILLLFESDSDDLKSNLD